MCFVVVVFNCICLCGVCVCHGRCVKVAEVKGQLVGIGFLLPHRLPGIELRSSGIVASTFIT